MGLLPTFRLLCSLERLEQVPISFMTVIASAPTCVDKRWATTHDLEKMSEAP
jgi:hypothetical protein